MARRLGAPFGQAARSVRVAWLGSASTCSVQSAESRGARPVASQIG